MRFVISSAMAAFLLVLPLGAPPIAGQLTPAALPSGAGALDANMNLAAFTDGPPTAPHHGRRSHSGETSKPVEPSHSDMNGATREDADKAYRKQYGF